MSVRKFIAPTAREALRDIRNELGDEAVILSNRKVGEGVEIIALANEEQLSGIKEQWSGVKEQGSGVKGQVSGIGKESSSAMVSENPILIEIKSMQNMLQQQFAALSWNEAQHRDPQRAGLLRRMLNSGFSALLARRLLDKMPAGKEQAESWIKQVLKHNLIQDACRKRAS